MLRLLSKCSNAFCKFFFFSHNTKDEASAVAGPRACKQHAHNLSTSCQYRVGATYYTAHEARQAANTHWRFLVRQMRRDRRPMRNTTPRAKNTTHQASRAPQYFKCWCATQTTLHNRHYDRRERECCTTDSTGRRRRCMKHAGGATAYPHGGAG